MTRRLLGASSIVVALGALGALGGMVGTAAANGRPPNSETLHFRAGHPDDIIAGLTFGMVVSHDGGATWQWMCEAAVGYAGLWDPIYQWTSSGALFATTFNGLTVNRTGCTFDVTPLGATFATAFAAGPYNGVADGALYVGMSDTSASTPDDKIYKSIDDGMTFNAGVVPPGAISGDWWESLVTAPSDPMRVYLSGYGYRQPAGPSGAMDAAGSPVREFFLYKSIDGGASFTALPAASIAQFSPVSTDTTIDLVGVSPSDANVLYARVNYEDKAVQTSIYRSADGGDNWTKVVCGSLPCAAGAAGVGDVLGAFTIDSHGNVYVGSSASGTWKSTDNGVTFTNTPTSAGGKIFQCLATDPSDNIWGCGDNYGSAMMGIGESADFSTWTTKLKFQDIQQPVTCDSSTVQYGTCQAMTWCGLRQQLGVIANTTECPIDAGAASADVTVPPAKGKGCCDAGAGPSGLALAGLVGILMWRPRRRRPPTSSC